MKKIKIFLFLILVMILMVPSLTSAACNDPSWSQNSCPLGKTSGSLDDCAGINPPWGQGTPQDVCCCKKEEPANPNNCYWQLESNTLQGGNAHEVHCNTYTVLQEGFSKCAGLTKPNPNLFYGCCCASVIPQKTTEIEVPKFPIPELQIKIPTVNLTETTCAANDDGTFACQVPWLGQYISGIYEYGLGIVGILAAIVLMAGGVLWLVSGGDASKITQARELIIGSITGLIILMTSYIILLQINPELIKTQSLDIGTIKHLDFEPISSLGNPNNSKDCNNCVEIKNIPCKNGKQANFDLVNRLTTAWNNSCGDGCVTWQITEAYPHSSEHQSTCHYNGMCVDITLAPNTGPTNCDQVKKLIVILKNANLIVDYNEYPACGGQKTKNWSGGHLHVR